MSSFKQIILISATFILAIAPTDAQNIYTCAGTGSIGFSGDGGQATLAQLKNPIGVTVDGSANIFITDNGNHRIRKITSTGIISSIAGTGAFGYSGDGGQASLAQISSPSRIAVDASGNIYFADQGNNRIRKIDVSGIITTIAGTGVSGYSGDGGAATLAQVNLPGDVTVDALGNVYFSEFGNNCIRKVSNTGTITTIAGTGVYGFSGDGGAATTAKLASPFGIAVDGSNNIYVSDGANNRIRKINSVGIISTIAGTGVSGFSGDGGLATSAQIAQPTGIILDPSGSIYFGDGQNNRIRKINLSGIINTAIGTGVQGFSGDGGLANQANINGPSGIAIDGSMNIYFADYANNRVRVVCSNNCFVGLNSISADNSQVFVYPNPNNGFFKLQLDGRTENCNLVLFNSLGQKVHEQIIFQGANSIDVVRLSQGLYHYVLFQNNVSTKSGNVTIE